jgi:hypothetical protein
MKKLFLFALLGISLFGMLQADSSATMVVSADIVGDVIGIEVTEAVDFGELSRGSISERRDINVTNTGTVNILVTPELSEDYSGDIFNYLTFQRVLSDPKRRIGNFSIAIDKPSSSSGSRIQKLYMYLDLTEYPGAIEGTLEDHQAEVIFWATPA